MNKKSVRDVDVRGKRVFVRVDFNVPMEDGAITDDTRITEALPTITYLMERGAKVILASHLGRPDGKVVEDLRLAPIVAHLSILLGQDVFYNGLSTGDRTLAQIEMLEDGEVFMLENVRFESGEEINDPALSQSFATLADIFVNDAFGAAHRAHASTSGIASHLPAVCGLLMERELSVLDQLLKEPKHPFTAIIGGSKIKDKIDVIDRMIEIADNVLIGGGLSYTFLKALGFEIGDSLVDVSKLSVALNLIEKAKLSHKKLLLPTDVLIADSFSAAANTKNALVSEIMLGWQGLDIGPLTAKLYAEVIASSGQIIWNGPMGVFEMDIFSHGTSEVAIACAKANGYCVIGGGDSAAAISKFGLTKEVDHISTGGGASLEYLEGKPLPGIAALLDK